MYELFHPFNYKLDPVVWMKILCQKSEKQISQKNPSILGCKKTSTVNLNVFLRQVIAERKTQIHNLMFDFTYTVIWQSDMNNL